MILTDINVKIGAALRHRPTRPYQMTERFSLPTILVAVRLPGTRERLIRDLQGRGYFVLDACDTAKALGFVRLHSRAIHLMLADGSPEGRSLASTAQLYRPAMQVLLVTEDDRATGAGAVTAGQALAAADEMFAAPGVPRSGIVAGASG
ncbi:MAG: hypothetical protein ABI759_29490 [Candidatus Solibacter sp.]